MEERVGLVDEVRRERLVREQAVAGERIEREHGEEQDQVDAVALRHLAPTHAQGILPGASASRSNCSAP